MGRGLPELSGLAAAHAVIANPKLILADEPTGNLHSSHRVINLADGWVVSGGSEAAKGKTA